MLAACYLALGKLAPDFQQIELRVGGSTIATAISEATGVTRAQLGRMHDTMGDMGDVAEKCRVKQVPTFRPLPLWAAGMLTRLPACLPAAFNRWWGRMLDAGVGIFSQENPHATC